MNANKILLVLIIISFVVLAFTLKNKADYISELRKTQETESNTSSTSTSRTEDLELEAPKKVFHIVKEGDTLWDIAEKHYGSGFKYHEIIKKNPGKTFKFKDGREGLIYPGTELIL